MTCLMLAAKSGYSKVINLLMSYGAEINAQDKYGYTVSHHISLVYCVWPNLNYTFLLQALALAVQHGTQEAVIKLLLFGADKTLKTNTGKCPADLAAIFEKTEVQFFDDTFKKFRVYSENSTFFQNLNMMILCFLHKCHPEITKPTKKITHS